MMKLYSLTLHMKRMEDVSPWQEESRYVSSYHLPRSLTLYFELVSLEVNHEQVMSPSIYSHRKIDNGRYVWILTHLTGHRILTKLMKPFTVKTKAIILNRLGNSQLSLYEELST